MLQFCRASPSYCMMTHNTPISSVRFPSPPSTLLCRMLTRLCVFFSKKKGSRKWKYFNRWLLWATRERYDDPLSGGKAEMRETSSKNLAFFSFYLSSESCCRVEWMLFDREMKRPVGMRWRGERANFIIYSWAKMDTKEAAAKGFFSFERLSTI